MFKEELKKQYWLYCLVFSVVAVHNIIRRGFLQPVALDILVNVFLVCSLAFGAFCLVFFLTWIGKKMRPMLRQIPLPKISSVFKE